MKGGRTFTTNTCNNHLQKTKRKHNSAIKGLVGHVIASDEGVATNGEGHTAK